MKSSLPLLSILALVITLTLYHTVWAQSPNRAGLVIDYGEGHTETYCVKLGQDTSNGRILQDKTEERATPGCKIRGEW